MIINLRTIAQRWSHRSTTWRPQRELFDPRCYEVAPLPHTRIAKDFVLAHHYSGTFPVALACYGLFERTGWQEQTLVGVVVFSVPVQAKAGAAYGAGTTRFCDLGRFLLADRVGGNAETWTLRRALKLLAAEHQDEHRRPKYPLVLAYSDPVPRTDARGTMRFNGHYGGIYREKSALYLGRATRRRIWLAPDGTSLSDRALSKLRTGGNGAAYTYEQLRRHGAPNRAIGEADAAYVSRALREGPFRAVQHPGNHVYAFTLGSHASRKSLAATLRAGGPYPTHTDPMNTTGP
ncbi:hypothetical protein [Acidiphilium rubrum]|uniref:Mom family adenine methylcarbamoylation protein n=2 Tax=Acidiphilium rubrum TaxID=526 RepID=UPI002B8B7140|nr:hypothetical protein [Acidiphilium rubrum]HQT86782.1 hypothetical protein [Acidiphilium rubrum]